MRNTTHEVNGPATTFVPPHMTMDIRFNRRLQLHISSRHMTTSTTCGFFGAPCRSSCFRGCKSVSRPSCTSIASTAHPIRLEERHGGACVLPSPEWTPCERSFSGCRLLRIEERKPTTSFGNGSSRQRRSLHGYPPTLHGPFAVMPYVGEGTVNIWPFMKRTWGCRDVLSRRTFSLWIWCSLVTQEVLKSLLFSPTWPLKGCVWGVGSERKRSSHPSFQVSVDHCLLLL